MKFLENDLEEIIYTTSKNKLIEKGLPVYGKLFRQLRIGNYGIADLVEIERISEIHNNNVWQKLIITIYELKKDKIGISAFLQAVGYLKGIKRYIEVKYPLICDLEFKIVLIGSKVDTSSTFTYLTDLLPTISDGEDFLANYTYSIDIDGLEFNRIWGYKLNDEGFKDE